MNFADIKMKTLNGVHRTMMKITGGRFGDELAGMPVVELHTTGRKSGQRRSVMLTSPISDTDSGRYVLIASKGGDERHPEWYKNLVADGDVQLTVDGQTLDYSARTAEDEERAELWPTVTSKYKGYAGYQRKTEREIPVVICDPR